MGCRDVDPDLRNVPLVRLALLVPGQRKPHAWARRHLVPSAGTYALPGALRLSSSSTCEPGEFMATKGQFITQGSLSLASLWRRCGWGWLLGDSPGHV
jgi:hypothetical protein